jgi:hypothetical protein
MSRWFAALCAAALWLSPTVVPAQMAGALGKPLADGKLADGSVTIRLVDGSPTKPIANHTITLVASDGKSQSARTGADGRATFAKLKGGVSYKAQTLIEQQGSQEPKKLETDPFEQPKTGGLRFMLSAKPLTMPASAPAQGGMPDPRQMSGIARPQGGDPAGRLTVRAVQGAFSPTDSDAPIGANVHLVGFHADGSVSIKTKEVADDGRVIFEHLSTTGQVAYHVLGIFERDGAQDRLMTREPIALPPQVGLRLMLAGHGVDSNKPPADDIIFLGEAREEPIKPGRVLVRIHVADGMSARLAQAKHVELLAVGDDSVISKAPVMKTQPTAADVVGRAGRMPADAKAGPGAVSIAVVRPSQQKGVPGIVVRIEPAAESKDDAGGKQDSKDDDAVVAPSTPEDPAPAPLTGHTDSRGLAIIGNLEAGKKYVAIATVFGKELETPPFEVTDEPAGFAFAVEWPDDVSQAVFEGVAGSPDRVYYARLPLRDQTLHSPPFQLTDAAGAAAPIFIYPQVLFRLHAGAELDDTRMWFQAQISLANPSSTPLATEKDGLLIPLPKGFLGASVQDEMTTRVKVDPDHGLLWRGALPPGQRDFMMSFALPVENGEIAFDLPLPYGLTAGQIVFEDLPGMKLDLPEGVRPIPRTMKNGRKFLMVAGITIDPQQRLVFGVRGLPVEPTWRVWVKLGVGLSVIALFAWALLGVFARRAKSSPAATKPARRPDLLLDELARVETRYRDGDLEETKYKKERARLLKQLESVFDLNRKTGS